IQINSGTTTLKTLLVNDISLNGGSLISYSSTGNLNIDGCTFTNIQKTNAGNGSVINGMLSSTSGIIQITGSSTTSFTNCQVTSSGLGGAIYLDIQTGGESKYDFSKASYSIDNSAQYGKSLFINATNLRTAVPLGDGSRIKLGALNPETDFYNLMGYDNGDDSIAIPLYYMYTGIEENVYHVNIDNGQSSGSIGGIDNIGKFNSETYWDYK
ncbi:MAG: hypothetical protein EZS28_051277, partial [Streblomastix strix]